MSLAERASSTPRPLHIPRPSENVRLAVIVLAFLTLHVLAGTWAFRAQADEPGDRPNEAVVSSGD